MQVNVQEILLAVIILFSTIITSVLVPFLKSKLTTEQSKDLANVVKTVVLAVEQLANSNVILKEDKKKIAIERLSSLGIDVTDKRIYNQIDLLIEAFVSEMNGAL